MVWIFKQNSITSRFSYILTLNELQINISSALCKMCVVNLGSKTLVKILNNLYGQQQMDTQAHHVGPQRRQKERGTTADEIG